MVNSGEDYRQQTLNAMNHAELDEKDGDHSRYELSFCIDYEDKYENYGPSRRKG